MARYTESKKRTLVKALLLRVIVFILITLATVFIFKQSFTEGLEFGVMDIVIELLSHYVYDRVWAKIEWGVIDTQEKEEVVIEEEKLDEDI